MTNAGGKGVPNAIVKLNGQKLTKTNSDGVYSLENMKGGSYSLAVEAGKFIYSIEDTSQYPAFGFFIST